MENEAERDNEFLYIKREKNDLQCSHVPGTETSVAWLMFSGCLFFPASQSSGGARYRRLKEGHWWGNFLVSLEIVKRFLDRKLLGFESGIWGLSKSYSGK